MARLDFDASKHARPSFDKLPDIPAIRELKSRRQWVSWHYAERVDAHGKTTVTKPPMCPHTTFGASVSKPQDWGYYNDALRKTLATGFDGVGFVLTEEDGLTGADLDHCRNPETGEYEPWAAEIVALKETYMEISPSEEGLRLIWRGKVGSTFKHGPAQVEVYRAGRYLTITGDHVPGTPDEIRPAPQTEALLRARVEKARAEAAAKAPAVIHASAAKSDFFRRVNDAALGALDAWVPELFPSAKHQRGTGAWRISSRELGRALEEDLSIAPTGIRDFGEETALTAIDVVMSYGASADARAAAFWLCARLGRTPASFGWQDDDGRAEAGAHLTSQLLAEEDGEDLPADAQDAPAYVGEIPAALLKVPGLVGEIADWITATAIYPQPALSLGAALAIVGTASGRHLAGPTLSGTHLYVIVLAPSGAGKDHPRAMVGKILRAAGLGAHVGPSEFISMPGVINFIVRCPLAVCAMDEFGSFLKRINGHKASGFEGAISGMLRSAWGMSFQTLQTPEWASRQTEEISAPALSLYGVATAADFFRGLEGADIENGVLNRFLLIESERRPRQQVPTAGWETVPAGITAGLKAIYDRHTLNQLLQSKVMPAYERLGITEGAEALRQEMIAEIQAMEDKWPRIAPFLARAAENAIRLATILAIGCGQMTVEAPDMAWAREFVLWSTQRMAQGAGLYIADSETQAMANAIKRAIPLKGKMTRKNLLRKLAHKYKRREMDEVLDSLVESEEIKIYRCATGKRGRPTTWYLRT
jgi:hypothetical protein